MVTTITNFNTKNILLNILPNFMEYDIVINIADLYIKKILVLKKQQILF